MAAQIVDVRNPNDLTATYNQIEISGSAASDMSAPTVLTSNTAIDTANASDLSMGYTSYVDATGYAYYQFRYKASGSGALSAWSDIYAANTTIMHTRFRKKMKDINSSAYYFSDNDISYLLQDAVYKLFPRAYNEVIDESLTSSDTTLKYTFPIGVFRVNSLELIDSNGRVTSRPDGYSKRARQIIFDSPLSNGYVIRLYCDKKFQKLAEVPEQFDDLIIDLMRLGAYETWEADRSRYFKYTTIVNPEGGNLPSLSAVINRLERTVEKRLDLLKRVRRPGNIRLN